MRSGSRVLLYSLFGILVFNWFLYFKTQKIEEESSGRRDGQQNGEVEANVQENTLKVATFNVWNFKYDWTKRFEYIAEMMKEESPGIIGLQEVRIDLLFGTNQMKYLQKLLPQYKHIFFQPINDVPGEKQSEGIGILSIYPIVESEILELSQASEDTDRNKRICIRTLIEVPFLGYLNVFLTHLSYADVIQCRHAVELYRFVNSFDTQLPQIFLGDFNIYYDFEYPMDLFTGKVESNSKCIPIWTSLQFDPPKSIDIPFRDIWLTLRPNETGLTFVSTTPGLDSCRPDRILRRGPCLQDEQIVIRDDVKMQLSDHFAVFATFTIEDDCK